jgi:hypothetical protein
LSPSADPNYTETTGGGPELTVALLPRSDKVTLTTMDSRMPIDAFEVRVSLAGGGGGEGSARGAGADTTPPHTHTPHPPHTHISPPLPSAQPCLDLAAAGCRQIFEILRSAVREHTRARARALGVMDGGSTSAGGAGAGAAAAGAELADDEDLEEEGGEEAAMEGLLEGEEGAGEEGERGRK